MKKVLHSRGQAAQMNIKTSLQIPSMNLFWLLSNLSKWMHFERDWRQCVIILLKKARWRDVFRRELL